MRQQATKLLVILGFLYWGSGLARYAHESQEAAELTASQVTAAMTVDPALPGVGAAAQHCPDECPVCQILSTLRADGQVIVAAPIAPLELAGSLVIPSPSTPDLPWFSRIQSRGPPVVAA